MVHQPQGYILEHRPSHPAANRFGYVQQHRLVAEHLLERFLKGPEVVHHEDRSTSNNRPGNLWLFPSHSDHMRHHKHQEKRYDHGLAAALAPLAADPTVSQAEAAEALGCCQQTVKEILKAQRIHWVSASELALDEASVRAALQGRTTLEAATLLGVNHGTIRNRFPHLISKRGSPGFLEAHREEIRSRARSERTPELCSRFGCHQTALTRAIANWAKAEPDAWKDVLEFRRSRLGMKWKRGRSP